MRNTDNVIDLAAITQRRPRTAAGVLRGRDGWAEGLWLALRAIASRRRLGEMDSRLLADIGLTRAEALREAGRAPWDLGPPPRDRSLRRPWP